MVKYYKIVYGYGEGDYLPITSDELHKAFFIAMQGGKAIFESGFFQNRGQDVMRIVPDWHRVRGWNRGWKMTLDDFEDIKSLEESYLKTLENGKLLAEYIVREGRQELLSKPARVAFEEVKQLVVPESRELIEGSKELVNKFTGK